VLHASHRKYRTQKVSKKSPSGHHRTTFSGYIFATKAHINNRKKNLSSSISSRCPHNIANFCPLAAEIDPVVWGTPANFNGFRVLAVLLHGTLVVVVSQTLRCSTGGATYIRQGDHHVRHWPTFLVWHILCTHSVSYCIVMYILIEVIVLLTAVLWMFHSESTHCQLFVVAAW